MPKEFRFPDLGEGIAEGELVKWLVKEGDVIREDQDVAEVETDKALVSIPSPVSWKIEKLNFKEGDRIPVGSILMTLSDGAGVESKAAAPKPNPAPVARESKEPEPASETKAKEKPAPAPTPPEKVQTKSPSPTEAETKLPPLATPSTRKLARELGIDLAQVKGSGSGGRITEEDLRNFSGKKPGSVTPIPAQTSAESAPAHGEDFGKYGEVEIIPIKGIRRKVSEHMLEAARNAVMVTHVDEAEVDQLISLRKEKAKFAEERGVKLTILPFLMKACVIALKNYPYLNASLVGDEIVLKKYFNFGFAVDTEAGLLVPVVRDVDQKSIMRLASELKDLSERARERKISLEEFKGHTFSITNIGSIGGRAFTPIINYPDSAILGMGRTYSKPVAKDGQLDIASVLPLCLTFDHRVTDGATAARFVNEVMKYLKDPDLLFLDTGET